MKVEVCEKISKEQKIFATNHLLNSGYLWLSLWPWINLLMTTQIKGLKNCFIFNICLLLTVKYFNS